MLLRFVARGFTSGKERREVGLRASMYAPGVLVVVGDFEDESNGDDDEMFATGE